MRIVVFGPERRVGAWEGDTIVDLNRAFASMLRERGEPGHQQTADARVPAGLAAFIAAGEAALDDARRAIEHGAKAGADKAPDGGQLAYAAADVRLHAPWPGRRIACAGGNFADHLLGMERHRGADLTIEDITRKAREEGQWGFWKVPDVVAATGDTVPYPKRTRYLDYEGEAAIILSKSGKDIPADRIEDYVWGITLLN